MSGLDKAVMSSDTATPPDAPYRVSVDEYVFFRQNGYLIVRNLVAQADVERYRHHMEDILMGREVIAGLEPTPDQPAGVQRNWIRVNMLHRQTPTDEAFILHPRILDVLEAIIGPDVLALHSMCYFKQPGQQGEGYHQDSYFIPTFPDTLCGAWLAIDPADEENGCLRLTPGSHFEPLYPDTNGYGYGNEAIGDIQHLENISHPNEYANGLGKVARTKYAGREILGIAQPGDVIFFDGHLFHRSLPNMSKDRMRRCFIGHYCNARSWVPWNSAHSYEGDSANYLHILARGETHLPYAQPRFGTPCAANQPRVAKPRPKIMSMMGLLDGKMGKSEHSKEEDKD